MLTARFNLTAPMLNGGRSLRPQSNGDLKRKWTWAVEWLGDELERRPYPGNPQYTYNNWSPPVQSNETSNGYFLERSHSARMTLAKACELCPEEVTPSPLYIDTRVVSLHVIRLVFGRLHTRTRVSNKQSLILYHE